MEDKMRNLRHDNAEAKGLCRGAMEEDYDPTTTLRRAFRDTSYDYSLLGNINIWGSNDVPVSRTNHTNFPDRMYDP